MSEIKLQFLTRGMENIYVHLYSYFHFESLCIIINAHTRKPAHTHENMHARIDFVLYKS
jgi:hypothetical protein